MPDYSAFFAALGARIRELRKAKRLSQEDMIPLGFSARHWQQIEAGRPITITTLLRACEALQVSISDILAGLEEFLPKRTEDLP